MANDYGIAARLGKQAGSNLFFSFSQFGLATGESATFSGPASVRNILARVTGGSASSIDGTLRSTIPNANLFLMNPTGVMFGPNAKLDISGSFVVGTADYTRFSDGMQLNTRTGNDAPLPLSSAPVTAFGFLSVTPAAVSLDHSQLSVQTATGLHIIAGDIALTGASVQAPSGALTVFSAASQGEVPFDLASPGTGYTKAKFGTLGMISLTQQAVLAIDGAGGGIIVIRGGKLAVHDSKIRSANSDLTPGGKVIVSANGELDIRAGGEISSSNISYDNGVIFLKHGKSGSVTVNAQAITIAGESPRDADSVSGIFSVIDNPFWGSTGSAGDVTVTATGKLSLLEGGLISASHGFGSGNAGNVTVTAHTITIAGTTLLDDPSGILASVRYGKGSAGDVTVTATGNLSIKNGGLISSSTEFGTGDGGRVTVNAQAITISGATYFYGYPSGIFGSASYAKGSAGDVAVTATGKLDIRDGGLISSSTTHSGNAGSVTVNAQVLAISGVNGNLDVERYTRTFQSGILASTDRGGKSGGNVHVKVRDDLNIWGGGQISASTIIDGGNAGSVTVNARAITISGATPGFIFPSGIFASVVSGKESAGDVTVTGSGPLKLQGGGQISASTTNFGNAGFLDGDLIPASTTNSGNAGSVTVNTMSIFLDGAGTPLQTGILATASGAVTTGSAGGIAVTGRTLRMTNSAQISAINEGSGTSGNVSVGASDSVVLDKGSQITAAAARGNAGVITIETGSTLSLSGTSEITASAPHGLGGNVQILVPDVIDLRDSSITATAGRKGGNISIDPHFMIVDHSTISARSLGGGQDGGLTIRSDYFFSNESHIFATGPLQIQSIDPNLASGLTGFQTVPLDVSTQLREQCARRLGQDFSSFLLLGPEGVEPVPDEPLGAPAVSPDKRKQKAN